MVGSAPPRPNLHGKADPAVVSTITQILDRLDLKSKTNGNSSAATSATITNAQLQQIRVALQATGGKALNVSNLIGVLAQPQNAAAPSVTSLPSFNSQLSQDGGLVALLPTDILYRFDGKSTNPGQWRAVAAAGVIAYGLRAAQPAPGQPGLMYWQTDYNAVYVDNGTNYVYAVGTHIGTDAARIALSISINDNGFLWFTSDTHSLYYVSSGAWVLVSSPTVVPSFAYAEVPKHFTLAHSPSPVASLQLFRNGALQMPGEGNDFTLTGASITTALIWDVGDNISAWYTY